MLKELFAAENIKPVHDSKAKWLRMHRPSVALLCCLGSGPWRLPRRTAVQARAIKLLKNRDLSFLSRYECAEFFPLKWQQEYLKAIIEARAILTPYEIDQFDQLIDSHKKNLMDIIQLAHNRIHGSNTTKPLPKVLGMFVRDYLYMDTFPIDRHVRKWLRDHKLPTSHKKLMAAFEAEKLHARYYARALFLNQSSNPVHTPTRKR